MKSLAKLLAVGALAVVVLAAARAVVRVAALDGDLCPGPGNNLIDNISPNVLENLHHDAGSPGCWLAGTFLFRTNDLSSPGLANFFTAAAANKVWPIVRIGGENNGDSWPVISPQLAAADASFLSAAVSASGLGKTIYAELGNEVNLDNEWGGRADPASYADSFIAYANALGSPQVKALVPPLTLTDSAARINVEDYYKLFARRLREKLPETLGCDPVKVACQGAVTDWIDEHIGGYGLNLYAAAGDGGAIAADKNRVTAAIAAAGLPSTGKAFIVTELGLPGGIYSSQVGQQACLFLQGLDVTAATIFSRDDQGRVHAFFYNGGDCSGTGEYRVAVINLGGSITYGGYSGYPGGGQVVYQPLGSVESCPTGGTSGESGCSPVSPAGNVCNSECSQPLEIDQGLVLTGSGCITGGGDNCRANISIRGNSLPVPGQTRQLADYFEGTLDTEKMSPADLDALQTALRKGYTDPRFDEALQKAGVARRLFPQEVLIALKCQFVDYVRNTAGTKYNKADYAQVVCPPKTEADFKALAGVPLFPNDDSLGKIEFVSPSLLTIDPLNVSLPQIQRLNLVTKEIQNLLVPTVQNEAPKTYGRAITLNSPGANSCSPTQSWDQVYGGDFSRAVACLVSPVPGINNLSGCVLLPDGTISCQRTDGKTTVTNEGGGNEATVQVRTVFPHLLETAQQTISSLQGLLQVFRPEDTAAADFSKNYSPIPAQVGNVKYELANSSGLAINDTGHKQNGWSVNFFGLGGVINARNFVLRLLNPTR